MVYTLSYSILFFCCCSSLGSFDKCVLAIREENKEKDMSTVVANVFAHANVAKKNILAVKLIVRKPGV